MNPMAALRAFLNRKSMKSMDNENLFFIKNEAAVRALVGLPSVSPHRMHLHSLNLHREDDLQNRKAAPLSPQSLLLEYECL